jgi:hypothetical protein
MKGTLLAAIAAVVALVPLYGDPRQTPVTHPEWAHLLLRAKGLDAFVGRDTTASLAFEALAPRLGLSLEPGRYLRADGVRRVEGVIEATGTPGGEVAYAVAAAQGGDYRVRLTLQGAPEANVTVDLVRQGEASPDHTWGVRPAAAAEAGPGYFRPGAYTLSVGLPTGTRLERVEFVPPCMNPIEPIGGWRATAITDTVDVAVTLLKALSLEHELPPAATPTEVPSLAFVPTMPTAVPVAIEEGPDTWIKGAAQPVQVAALIDVAEAGTYTIYAYGYAGAGQSWVADSCHKAVTCASLETPETPRWRPVLTSLFSAGQHSILANLGAGAGFSRLRVEKKRDAAADYLGVLARLGLDFKGQERPVTRPEAADAARLLRRLQGEQQAACLDVIPTPVSVLVAGLAGTAGSVAGPGAPGPLPPGVLPPVVVPIPSPAPPTVPTTIPPPTEPTPPPTIPTLPPGSPTVPIK